MELSSFWSQLLKTLDTLGLLTLSRKANGPVKFLQPVASLMAQKVTGLQLQDNLLSRAWGKGIREVQSCWESLSILSLCSSPCSVPSPVCPLFFSLSCLVAGKL